MKTKLDSAPVCRPLFRRRCTAKRKIPLSQRSLKELWFWRVHDDARMSRSVLECASPLALWAGGAAGDLILVGRRCSVAQAQGGAAAPPYRSRVDEFGERFSEIGTDRLPARTANPGLMDLNSVGILGWSAYLINHSTITEPRNKCREDL
jgi:hypothetical protein